jgi:NADPH:quinone reductase-like Zn-dependent oxidoreductase/acyl carrier protein
MGFMDGAMGTVATADHRLLVGVPGGLSFVQAASVPIAFATAYYGLVDLGGVERGERLLVHAAAGGVGIAAVQIAAYLGVEVFGTASHGKWGVLEDMGIPDSRIASSRTLDFKEKFSGGGGVDVVLNSLAGEFVDASLGLLGEGGRFLEMGKTDIRDPGVLAGEHPGVVYRAFDVMDAGPERLREILVELKDLFERGVLDCPPITAWNVRRAQQAFRHMSQGRHVGKNVLRLPAAIDTNGTVLITGGTGGLGAQVARHLVTEHGARHLLLVSRNGPAADGAGDLERELSSLGASVRIAACDVADREQLEGLLADIPREHPLDAVFHAAGVIDDGLIGSLSAERIERVWAPKATGAWNLHDLTMDLDLSVFVLFSSITGTLASPGQGNYAAANASLDALASYRQAQGLAGISIAWGLWEQQSEMTGHLAERDLARMARNGLQALSNADGLRLLDEALAANEAHVITTKLDIPALRTQARNGELPALLSGIINVRPRDTTTTSDGSLSRRLAQTPQDQHHDLVLQLVRAATARVLGYSTPEAIDPQRTFKDLGLDSLAGVELRNRLAAQTGARLPATLIFDHPTPDAAARHLLALIESGGAPTTASLDAEMTEMERRLSAIVADGMTRAKVTARLTAFLAGLSDGEHAPSDDEDVRSAATAEEVFELIDRELGSLDHDTVPAHTVDGEG